MKYFFLSVIAALKMLEIENRKSRVECNNSNRQLTTGNRYRNKNSSARTLRLGARGSHGQQSRLRPQQTWPNPKTQNQKPKVPNINLTLINCQRRVGLDILLNEWLEWAGWLGRMGPTSISMVAHLNRGINLGLETQVRWSGERPDPHQVISRPYNNF